MATFTVGEVALMLEVSPSTIRNYTEQPELQPYLSSLATRTGQHEGAKERQYMMEDVIVLNTARIHKTRTSTWDDVAKTLESGHREADLPETAALVMPETRADTFQIVARARQQIIMLQQQNEELQEQLQNEQNLHRGDIERLMTERADLHEQIGKLKFILQMNSIDPETGRVKGE